MISNELTPFDFRNSGATNDTIGVLKSWMRKAVEIFQERLERISIGSVEIRFHQVLSRTFENEVGEIDSESFGYEIEIGEPGEPTLAYVSCMELVAIVSCLLGNEPQEVEDSRKLTSIENSIGRMILGALASALNESWPGENNLAIVAKQNAESPHRSRMMPMDCVVLRIEIAIEVDVAKGTIVWLLQRKNLEPVLRSLLGSDQRESNSDPRELVELLELELVAVLGEIEIGMRDLTEMNVGDLVPLKQKITNPIQVNICGTPSYQVWPGRVGSQQVVQVIDLV